jgi:hypothetical protein
MKVDEDETKGRLYPKTEVTMRGISNMCKDSEHMQRCALLLAQSIAREHLDTCRIVSSISSCSTSAEGEENNAHRPPSSALQSLTMCVPSTWLAGSRRCWVLATAESDCLSCSFGACTNAYVLSQGLCSYLEV